MVILCYLRIKNGWFLEAVCGSFFILFSGVANGRFRLPSDRSRGSHALLSKFSFLIIIFYKQFFIVLVRVLGAVCHELDPRTFLLIFEFIEIKIRAL